MAANISFLENLVKPKLPVIGEGDFQPSVPFVGGADVPATSSLPVITDPIHGQPMTASDKYGQLPPISATVEPAVAAAVITPPVEEPAAPVLPIIEQSPRQQLEGRLNALNSKDYSIQKDADGNVIHRGKDRDKNWSLWDKIGSALVGWAQGGIGGAIRAGTDRNYFEKTADDNERARLLPKIGMARDAENFENAQEYKQAQTQGVLQRPILEREKLKARVEAEQQKFVNRTKLLEIQARNEGGKWKPYVDENGRRWKQYQNDPSKELEPIVDPITGEQDVDPSSKLYDWTDPYSGKTVQIKGSQLANAGATIATGNAQRQQSADTTNVNNELEAARANATAQNNWYQAENTRRQQALAAAAGNLSNAAEVQGSASLMQEYAAQMQRLTQIIEAGSPDDAQVKAAQNDLSKAEGDYAKALNSFNVSLGKTQQGAMLADSLSKSSVPRPQLIKANKVKAAQVGGPPSKAALENSLRSRGYNPKSPEWSTVMQSAGY